jgi:O-succinylbenzoate synthase
MQVWVHRYELVPKRALSSLAGTAPRRGALIRAGSGFADVHPWPELGDFALDEQLAKLARGDTTPLTRASLRMAAIDGVAREGRWSLFEGLAVPPSHWHDNGDPVPPGFDTVKVKMRADSDVAPLRRLAGFRLRLDFNATPNADQMIRFVRSLPADVRQSIDFLEDPCPYDAAVWRELRASLGLRLALDRGYECDAVDVLVVKPAVQEARLAFGLGKEVVITSYMDHPVGQLGAAFIAATHADRVARCGLLTHTLFEKNDFIEQIRTDGARLVPPEGSGIGFDQLLETLPWKKLA